MVLRISALLLSLLLAGHARAQEDFVSDKLQPGQFEWTADAASVQGPLLVVVSLADQRAWVFRNGVRVATSTVSTGKPGKETPTGVFPILEKRKTHRSNLYDNAPMPFMQRLTWDGVALHGGRIPGYPASHGCVRLPADFARDLFAITRREETVVVSPDGRFASLLAVGLPEWQARQVASDMADGPAAHDLVESVAQQDADRYFETDRSSTVMAD